MAEAPNFVDVASMVLGMYGIFHQQNMHKTELAKARRLHREAIGLSQKLTEKSLVEVKRFYLLELFNNLQQHFQQLNADLISSAKEAERDMFDQRNQSLQTIILSGSVMFGALSTAIVNGTLSEGTRPGLIWGFGLASAISFGALFISIVLCIETVIRASLFMYQRAQYFSSVLHEAIDETKNIIGIMRQKTENQLDPEKMAKIAKMTKQDLDKEWKLHSKIIKRYLEHRKNINNRLAAFRGGNVMKKNRRTNNNNNNNYYNNDKNKNPIGNRCVNYYFSSPTIHEFVQFLCCCLKRPTYSKLHEMTFNEFWEEKCEDYATWALFLFYLGTATLIVTIACYLWSKFDYTYHTPAMAWISSCLVLIFFAIGSVIAVFLRTRSRGLRRIQAEEEAFDDDDDDEEEQRKRRVGGLIDYDDDDDEEDDVIEGNINGEEMKDG